MQYSLRNLLLSLAVAGIAAGMFCAYLPNPPATTVACVVILLFGATLLGQIFGREQKGGKRAACWLMPPMFAALAVLFFAKSMLPAMISEDEYYTLQACVDFAEAEEIYHRTDYNKDGVNEYAPSLKELHARLGANFSKGLADAEWPSDRPYNGYYFKVLKSRKLPDKRSYIDENGRMTQGYAIIAWPAEYGWTGVKQFMTSNSGPAYESDYGSVRDERGEQINEFNPVDPTWTFTP